jgi:opacity protein-like surface antigen
MKGILRIALLGLVGVALVTVPASAQLDWAGSLYLGYAKATNDGMPDGSIGGRANAFLMVHPVVGVGAELGYYNLGSLSASGGGVGADASFHTWQVTANAMARGVTGNVRPFAIGGLGLYPVGTSTTIDIMGFTEEVSASSTEFGFNLGGGVNFQPSPGPVSFGFEGRWHSILSSGESLNLLTLTGGINFR